MGTYLTMTSRPETAVTHLRVLMPASVSTW